MFGPDSMRNMSGDDLLYSIQSIKLCNRMAGNAQQTNNLTNSISPYLEIDIVTYSKGITTGVVGTKEDGQLKIKYTF